MPRWVELRYKCQCMKAESCVQVQERESGEDIGDFMERVRVALTDDHKKRSPFCRTATMEYAKVPAPAAGIGTAEGGTA